METLRRYWGYHEFRPKQESIIRSLLAGRDTCVVMPTGGGKSLCYQLPAVVSGKTTVVVSPLIALMQDQAAQLAQMGIPAAAVNSFQTSAESSQVRTAAKRGEYSFALSFAGAAGAGGYFRLAEPGAGGIFRGRRGALYFVGPAETQTSTLARTALAATLQHSPPMSPEPALPCTAGRSAGRGRVV